MTFRGRYGEAAGASSLQSSKACTSCRPNNPAGTASHRHWLLDNVWTGGIRAGQLSDSPGFYAAVARLDAQKYNLGRDRKAHSVRGSIA